MMCYFGFVTAATVVDAAVTTALRERVGLEDLNIPAGCERGGHLIPKKASLLSLISEKCHHNPIHEHLLDGDKQRSEGRKKGEEGARRYRDNRVEDRMRWQTFISMVPNHL